MFLFQKMSNMMNRNFTFVCSITTISFSFIPNKIQLATSLQKFIKVWFETFSDHVF
eukprot:Awhi_evm1s3527